MVDFEPQVKDKNCPFCKKPLIMEQSGRFGYVWICPLCHHTETLAVAGIWHPDISRPPSP